MTKEKIIEVAEGLFFARQHTDVKLDAIADAVDIKKPTLYYYFSSKQELFLETIDYSYQRYKAAFDVVLATRDIDTILNRYISYPSAAKNLFGISFHKHYHEDPQVQRLIQKYKKTVVADLEGFFGTFTQDKVSVYLAGAILEQVTYDNCIEGNCLPFSTEKVVHGIKKLFA